MESKSMIFVLFQKPSLPGEKGVDKMHECCQKKKLRPPEERQALINRLNRIEGQIRGLRRMLEEDAYCPDVLVQASAASAAIGAFSRELLEAHIRTCVVEGVRNGDETVVDELMQTLQRMMK